MVSQLGEIQKSTQFQLPRLNRSFIGKSHQLQSHKKKRRSIELQQRSISNRVLFLEKLQKETKVSLNKKKSQLNNLISIFSREREQFIERQKESKKQKDYLELLLIQNQNRRKIHKKLKENNSNKLHQHNHKIYKQIKLKQRQNQIKIKEQKQQQQSQKQKNMLKISLGSKQSQMKINQFFKKRNTQHTKHYKNLIKKQDVKTNQKIQTIRRLQPIKTSLRQQLKMMTIKVNEIQELIHQASQTLGGNNSSRASASTTKRSTSLINQTISQDKLLNSNKLSIQAQIEEKNSLNAQNDHKNQRIIHKKRQNKHKNRYRKYEAF